MRRSESTPKDILLTSMYHAKLKEYEYLKQELEMVLLVFLRVKLVHYYVD